MHSTPTGGVQLGRRRLTFALPLLACGLVVPSVRADSTTQQFVKNLMGTRVSLTLQGDDPALLSLAAANAFAEMTRLADMMSRYRPTSVVSAVNLMAGLQPVAVPPEMMQVLLMARQLAHSSGGNFDTTVGSLHNWNFDPAQPTIASAQQIASQLDLVDQQNGLIIDEQQGTAYLKRRGMRLDLGGIAKLPILQAGLAQIKNAGVAHAMINGGGDVLVMGELNGRPWRVGLRDPRQPDKLLGVVALTHGIVAASGDYERYVMHRGQRLHHILDPKTGYPTQGPHGVTLISDQLGPINGLGAAIMVAGMAAGKSQVSRRNGVDALIIDADDSLWLSPGMQARLTQG